MGKPIVKEFGQNATILKFFDYKGASCVVPTTGGVVKAGTPFPSNDASALGYLLNDVDTTNGDAPGTYVYEGVIDARAIDSTVVISGEAKKATPKVTFYGNAY